MYLFEQYQQGTLESTLNAMETKAIIKSFKLHGFGRPSKNREKVIQQFIKCMQRDMRKGDSFLKAF